MFQAELWLQSRQVDEVTRFGSPEDGQDLVNRELLDAEDWAQLALLRREKTLVDSNVDTRLVSTVAHEDASETRCDLLLSHR